MRTPLLVVISLTGTLSACAPTTAVVHGQTVARPNLGYTDHRYFAVEHKGAYPEARGPSSGLHAYGGRIDGSVCGANVAFETDYYGHFLDVSGFISPSWLVGRPALERSARFEVRDSPRGRAILGTVGRRVLPIEIYMRPDAIEGQVGQRHYKLDQLDAQANELRGTVRLNTWLGERTLPFVVRGVQQLWSMPPADQAVLMPLMLSCLSELHEGGPTWQPVLGVDFTGDPAAPPPPVSISN